MPPKLYGNTHEHGTLEDDEGTERRLPPEPAVLPPLLAVTSQTRHYSIEDHRGYCRLSVPPA